MLDSFDDKRLIFVTGKGGVGKSTATAALGAALAERGRKVLVVETDTFSAMSEMLGARTKGGVQPVQARPGVDAVNLTTRECLVSTLTRFLPSERIVRAVTSNRVAEAFFDSAPSVSEFVLLDQIQLHVEQAGSKYDHILVDLPASGHAVTFLSVPKTLNGMMRGVGPIAKRAEVIDKTIRDGRRTAIVAVCLPEEMPVNETIELTGQLRDTLGRGLDLALVNMVHRPPIDGNWRASFHGLRKKLSNGVEPAELLAGSESDPITRLVAGNALALDWYDRDMRYLGLLETRLGSDVIEIPMLYETDDRAIVDRIANHLVSPPDPDALAS